jgi:rhamnosyltransferase
MKVPSQRISITVCYFPDLALLKTQFVRLEPQVDTLIVLHNGPTPDGLLMLCNEFSAVFIPINVNIGLGYAQNLGIEYAIKLGANEILLMDQDSIPDAGMVYKLSQALQQDLAVAAAGPRSVDLRTTHSSYFLCDLEGVISNWNPAQEPTNKVKAVAHLISSGTLMRVSALQEIGLMCGDWFIDHIDTEWCLRAISKGWKIVGVSHAGLAHHLGDTVSTIWWLRSRQISHHSPLRDYYMFRNAVLMVRLSYVPWRWKRFHVWRLMRYFGFFVAVAPRRLDRVRMMVRGLIDGFEGRSGVFPISNGHSV